MTRELRAWRWSAVLLAAAIPLLALLLAHQRQPAPPAVPTPAATGSGARREIPIVVKVTVPLPPGGATPAAPEGTWPPPVLTPSDMAASGTGMLAFSRRQDGHDDLYALAGGMAAPVRLTGDGGEDRDPVWSPDGRLLAFSSLRPDPATGQDNWDIFVLDVASGALRRVTDDPELDRRPCWSPDGNWLAFESYRLGGFDIFLTSLDGEQVYQVTGDPSADLAPAWSPDGRYIAFVSYRSGDKDLWLADLRDAADGQAINLTRTPTLQEDDPAWSPDGLLLAYADASGGSGVTYVLPMHGPAAAGPATAVAAGARPAWSPDGRSLLTVFTPEADLAQTYLLAVSVRGQAGGVAHTMTAFGGLMRLQAASWTNTQLPENAGTSEAAAPRSLDIGAWLGQGMTDDAFGSATRHADALNTLSPYWYTVDWRGELTHYLTADDPEFIRFAHTHGLALYPTLATQDDLTNLRGVLREPARRDRHIRAIVRALETYGYDGIDLDYEGLTVDDRDALSALARELALVLRAEGLGLSVTVYPKANDGQTWIGPGANDYVALGQAADQVRIMAYEYHSGGGPSGPVGPLHWQEEVLEYAVARISPEKIVLGLHLYGRDWGSGGGAVLYRDVDQVRRSTGARVQWDQEAAESYFVYYYGGVLHRVWFPDALFVAVRVELAQRYGIGGLCFWRLGGEDETLWDLFRAGS